MSYSSESESYDPCEGKTSENYCNDCGTPIPTSDGLECACDCEECARRYSDLGFDDNCVAINNPCYGKTEKMCGGCGIPVISEDGTLCECDCSTCDPVVVGGKTVPFNEHCLATIRKKRNDTTLQ